MEKRKLQKTGGRSYYLILPKKWIVENSLQKNGRVYVFEKKSGSLLVTSAKQRETNLAKTIQADQVSAEEIFREILALYTTGIAEIMIKGKSIDRAKRLSVRKALQFLIGYELVEESSVKVVLKSILGIDNFSFSESVMKMHQMTTEMLKDAIISLEKRNADNARDVIERDFEVDRHYLLIRRIHNSLLADRLSEEELDTSLEESDYHRFVATQLERIADHAGKIAETVLTAELNFNPKFREMLTARAKKCLAGLEEIGPIIESRDKSKAHEAISLGQKDEKKILGLQKAIVRYKANDAFIIVDSLNRIRRYLMNIAEKIIYQSLA